MTINDNLQNAVAQVLLSAIQTAKQTGDWMKGQLPDVVHQLLTWNLISDCITILFTFVVVGIFALSLKRFFSSYRKGKEAYRSTGFDITDMSYGFAWTLWLLFGGISTAGFIITSAFAIYDALEIWFAPKVWLLEYAAHLLQNAH